MFRNESRHHRLSAGHRVDLHDMPGLGVVAIASVIKLAVLGLVAASGRGGLAGCRHCGRMYQASLRRRPAGAGGRIMTASRTRFARLPARAGADKRLMLTPLRVLIAISIHADNLTGESWPSLPTIEKESGVAASNISKAITALEEFGYLRRSGWKQGRHGRSRLYVVLYEPETLSPGMSSDEPDKSYPDMSSRTTATSYPGTTSPGMTSYPGIKGVIPGDEKTASKVIPGYHRTAHKRTAQGTAHRSCAAASGDLLGSERATADAADGFDAFWSAYPRKHDKGHARKAYTAALRKATAAAILAGLARYRFSDDAKFIPMATTWLNGERWNDQISPGNGTKPNPPHQRAPPANGGGHLGAVMRFYQTTQFDEDNADE